jgi:hypothetical protein
MMAQTVLSNPNPYYFVSKLPSYLPLQNTQFISYNSATCPSQFYWCINMPEINYVIAYAISNSTIFFPTLTNYPYSISQTDSFF